MADHVVAAVGKMRGELDAANRKSSRAEAVITEMRGELDAANRKGAQDLANAGKQLSNGDPVFWQSDGGIQGGVDNDPPGMS